MLQLLDTEEEILEGLAVRDAGPAQTLLHGGVDQAPRPRRTLPSTPQHVLDHRAPLFTLHPALLDQPVHNLLNPLSSRGRRPDL